MEEELQKLINKYYSTEDEINIALSGLNRYGDVCNCDHPNILKQIHEGDFDEVTKTCLECGGIVES